LDGTYHTITWLFIKKAWLPVISVCYQKKDKSLNSHTIVCSQLKTKCGGICADLQTNSNNCGSCGTVCADDESCIDGVCTPNIQGLYMQFSTLDNINQYLSGDGYNSVESWNSWFDLPNKGTPFTSVIVSGNTISLLGGGNMTLKQNGFMNKLEDTYSLARDLTTVIDSDGVIIAAEPYAFGNDSDGSSDLVKLSLPALITAGMGCFTGCTNLVDFSASLLQSVDENCFTDCTSITSLSLSNLGTTALYSFSNCNSLTSIFLPALEYTAGSCFLNCTSLTTINLPITTEILDGAFNNCTSLTYLNIPQCTTLGTTTDGNSVFDGIIGNNITVNINSAIQSDGDIVSLQADNTVTLNIV
jgi:hypothetical protein